MDVNDTRSGSVLAKSNALPVVHSKGEDETPDDKKKDGNENNDLDVDESEEYDGVHHGDEGDDKENAKDEDMATMDKAMEAEGIDKDFIRVFLPTAEGEQQSEQLRAPVGGLYYADYDAIHDLIDQYESVSALRLAIRHSTSGSKIYRCASHEKCNFKAKFGIVKGTAKLIGLKPKYCHFVHNGPRVEGTKDGRAEKRRLKVKLKKVIEAASDVNEQMDVVDIRSLVHGKGEASYQMLVPFLQEFSKQNPQSLAVHECDGDNHLTRAFVCPGTYL